jgi:hypothetical protein
MAVVNSEKEADVLRSLYFNYGPTKLQPGSRDDYDYETTLDSTDPTPTPPPEPTDANIHIGFHDIFIEGEYLTVRSK